MKIVKLKGGLGNQMFQYIFARYIEERCKEKVLLDFSVYEGRKEDNIRQPRITEFDISLNVASEDEISAVCVLSHKGDMLNNIYRLSIGIETVINRKYCFQKFYKTLSLDELEKYDYFDGYWQSWRYAVSMESIIQKEFVPKTSLSAKARVKVKEIESQSVVFVGIRRGDYVKNKKNLRIYGFIDESFYIRAMEIITQKVGNVKFHVFSNDIKWVKENMNFAQFQVICNEISEEVTDLEELIIMSKCSHAIISNSTYNGWAAWLIKNPDKVVVAPKRWFANGRKTEIVPDWWISI